MDIKLQESNNNIVTINHDLVILQEYERMYVGNTDIFPVAYFTDLGPLQKQEQALKIIRFALEKYLQWTPQNIRRYLTSDVLKKMKLSKIVNKYIDFPQEYSKDDLDMTYLAYLLYPKKFRLSIEDQCIAMFERVHTGSASKFPSTWIGGIEGVRRFSILLQYAILQMPRFQNLEAMYQYFSGPKGVAAMKKYKLYSFAITLYANVFEAFHKSMPHKLRSDFLYHYYRFSKKVYIR